LVSRFPAAIVWWTHARVTWLGKGRVPLLTRASLITAVDHACISVMTAVVLDRARHYWYHIEYSFDSEFLFKNTMN
jgi:hypothetical protein